MKRHRKALISLTLASLALAPAALGAEPTMVPSYSFEAKDGALVGPQELPAGLVTLSLKNVDEALHMMMLARLNDGVSLQDLQSALAESPDAAFDLVTLAGDFGPIMPGQAGVITFDLKETGQYAAVDMMSGTVVPLQVVATDARPARPQADLVVQELDFGYDIPAEVEAGEQVWEVVNHGQEPHEMILFKLQEGITVADLIKAMEENPEGEPPAEMVGGVMPMGVGYTNFVTLNLEPGDYAAWCFIPSPAHEHAPHFALGMAKGFKVVAQTASN